MKKISCILLGAAITPLAIADSMSQLDEVYVTGGAEAIETTPGSAHLMDNEQLEKFEYSDIHQVLGSVPGVYVRVEDGFGLRPNIAMRGATSDRSQKINIMEDGILIVPAPYSAPAAYYFPNVSRMESVEVFKGPSSIKYGPNTIGGSLNLVTTPIPEEKRGEIKASYGSHNYHGLHGYFGDQNETTGWLIEGLSYGSDGFKELDGGGDTGFIRNDFSGKFRMVFPASKQRIDIKLGYGDEEADETYLGLTEADFDKNPNRRYVASQLDKLTTEHTQVHVTHYAELSDTTKLTTRIYQNNFERAWNKFDDFHQENGTGGNIQAVLADPDNILNQTFYQLLTGERDSVAGNLKDLVEVTNNDRYYVSRGIDFTGSTELETHNWFHELQIGLRLHRDEVDRKVSSRAYAMNGGSLIESALVAPSESSNKASTDALALYIHDNAYYGENWTFNFGLRNEYIEGSYRSAEANNSQTSNIVIPGVGAFYQVNDSLGILAGVFKGFSPNTPQPATNSADPEVSLNTEFGLRYISGALHAELIGFFNDYDNLLGRCGNADSGCTAGDEFNGGRVHIAGLEAMANYEHKLGRWLLPLSFTYTYTDSAFQETFNSSFSQWGSVEEGDELPYQPHHQFRLAAGAISDKWELNGALTYTGKMRDKAGNEEISSVAHTDEYMTIDTTLAYLPNDRTRLHLKIDNLLDEQAIVSLRPFGARPNKPRSIVAGIRYRF